MRSVSLLLAFLASCASASQYCTSLIDFPTTSETTSACNYSQCSQATTIFEGIHEGCNPSCAPDNYFAPFPCDTGSAIYVNLTTGTFRLWTPLNATSNLTVCNCTAATCTEGAPSTTSAELTLVIDACDYGTIAVFTCPGWINCVPADCDDGIACSVDTCNGTIGECLHNYSACPVCANDTDCDDSNAATVDYCITGRCSVTASPCSETVVCGAGEGTCEPYTPSLCAHIPECVTDADCDDLVVCSVDSCNATSGVCSHDTTACDSCADNFDCDDSDASTLDYCVTGYCLDNGAPCGDCMPCSTGVCESINLTSCVHLPTACVPSPAPGTPCNVTILACGYWKNHPEEFYSTTTGSYETWICDRYTDSLGVDFGPMTYLNTTWDSTDEVHWLRLYCPYIAITAASLSPQYNPCGANLTEIFGNNTEVETCYTIVKKSLQTAYLPLPDRPFPVCTIPRPQIFSEYHVDNSDETLLYCEQLLIAFINSFNNSNVALNSGESFGPTSLISSAGHLSLF